MPICWAMPCQMGNSSARVYSSALPGREVHKLGHFPACGLQHLAGVKVAQVPDEFRGLQNPLNNLGPTLREPLAKRFGNARDAERRAVPLDAETKLSQA